MHSNQRFRSFLWPAFGGPKILVYIEFSRIVSLMLLSFSLLLLGSSVCHRGAAMQGSYISDDATLTLALQPIARDSA